MPATTAAPELKLDDTLAKLATIRDEMLDELVERDRTVHLLMLAMSAKTHVLILGGGGIAKTMAANMLHSHIEGAKKGYVLCSKEMPPEVLVGNQSLKALTERDEVDYRIEGHLPTQHMSILDEIFKLHSISLNVLLALLNERVFTTGKRVINVPLWFLIGLSNMAEYRISGDLSAFRDRFGIAILEKPVQPGTGFRKVLRGQAQRASIDASLPVAKTMLSIPEVEQLQWASRQIQHPDEVIEALDDLYARSIAAGLPPSVRRFGELLKNMASQALYQGRSATNLRDCALAEYMLWDDVADAPRAAELCSEFAGAAVTKAAKLDQALMPVLDLLNDLQTAQAANSGVLPDNRFAEVARVSNQLRAIAEDVEKAKSSLPADEDPTELLALLDRITDAQSANMTFMGM